MKVCCVSDLHGELPVIPKCDLLVIAGDICPHFERPVGGRGDIFGQSKWLMGPFAEWLESIPAGQVVGIWGNHDFIGQKRPDMVPKSLRWTLLNDSGCEILGVKIYGTPWQPWFYDWAFNAPSGLEGELFLAKKFAPIPDDTDIIICHGPPRGFGDVAPDGRPTGSTSLLDRILAVKPQLTVHGHIHCGYGKWTFPRGNAADGIIVNASVLDEAYRLTNAPIVVEISNGKKEDADDGDRGSLPPQEEPAQEAQP